MTSPLLRRALSVASVTGAFTPDDLAAALGLGPDRTERGALMRDLSQHVTEVTAPAHGWLLKPDARLAELSVLIARAQIDQLLAIAPPPRSADRAAQYFQRMLRGEAISLDDPFRDTADGLARTLAEWGAVLDAVQFARKVPALDPAKLAKIEAETKRLMVEAQRRRDLMVVLPDKHFGYEKVYRQLSEFLGGRTPLPDGDDQEALDERARLTRPMFVSGIGGVGKSALLARYFRYWQRRSDGPLTILLDFDRRQLNTGSPLELAREFLRQAAAGVHDKGLGKDAAAGISRGLSDLRGDLIRSSADSTHQRDLSELMSILPDRLSADWATPLRTLPVAVLFDSFEALDRRGGSTVENVLMFEALLRGAQVLPRVRSVFSGRAEPLPDAQMEPWFGARARRPRLEGLSPGAGADLIAAADRRQARGRGAAPLLTEPETRTLIAEALKGHPLALIMAVRFVHTRPEERDRLIAHLSDGTGGDFRAEFAQVFLYERILDRIAEPDVRRLAHPGLVLRMVTADLIRFVLAGPCLGRDTVPDATEAEDLMQRLAAEYWLVDHSDGGPELRHRADLRHLMLDALLAAPRARDSAETRTAKLDLRTKALEVARLARHYYWEGPPKQFEEAVARWQALPDDHRKAHGLYYASFAEPDTPFKFDETEAREMDEILGPDVDTLPMAWKARLDALLGADVTGAAFETLEPQLKSRVIGRRRSATKSAGQARTARGKFGSSDGMEWTLDDLGAEGRDPFDIGPDEAVEEAAPPEPSAAPPPSADAPEPAFAPPPATSQTPEEIANVRAGTVAYEIGQDFAAAEFERVLNRIPAYFEALAGSHEARGDLIEPSEDGFSGSAMWQIMLAAAACPDRVDGPIREALTGTMPPLERWATAVLAAADPQPPVRGAGTWPRDLMLDPPVLGSIQAHSLESYRIRAWAVLDDTTDETELSAASDVLALAVGQPDEHPAEKIAGLTAELEKLLMPLWEASVTRESGADDTNIDLSILNRVYLRASDTPFLLHREKLPQLIGSRTLSRLMRGLTPELYEPIVSVMSDIARDRVEAEIKLIEASARHWPRELRFSPARKGHPSYDPRGALTVVQTADRVGLLRTFLRGLADADPRIPRIAAMHDAITAWFFAPLAPMIDPD